MPQPPNFSQPTANSRSPNLLTANVQSMKWAGRSTRRPEGSKASYLHGSPVVEAVAVDVLGRPLALARRDEIPPCTHPHTHAPSQQSTQIPSHDKVAPRGRKGGVDLRVPSVSRQIRHWNWSPAPASMSISDGGGISGDDSDADDAAPRAGCSPIDDPPQPAPALLQPSSSSHPKP